MADGDGFAGFGIGRQASFGIAVLEVVDLGQRPRSAAQLGMIDDVGDPLAIDPDLTLAPKALQELLACPCRHALPRRQCAPGPYLASDISHRSSVMA
jgi:hypothetical protein